MSGLTDRLSAALADRYRIERELGAGGMATVYLAEDLKHKRKVALKVLKPELAAVLGAERFVQEITTTASLSHPHILPLFDSGTADGFLYYVMPFIEGETLRDKLSRETQLGVDEAIKIASEVADALDYAHRHGVIHRDIKPENILLHDGRPMVADFGIALAVSAAAGGRMTETGLSLGTPHYMSPEQATAEKDISGRSDIYSLASVLYEMLTGQPPHVGSSAQQIIMKIIAEPVEAVTRYRKSVPPHVASVLAKALEKLPADRFDTAKAFAGALADPHFTSTRSTARGGIPGAIAPETLRWRRIAMASGIALLALLATLVTLVALAVPAVRVDPPANAVRVSLQFPGAARFNSYNAAVLSMSRDGSMIAYMGEESGVEAIWIRELRSLTARRVPGSGGGSNPFFSPDGRRLAFVSTPVSGSTAQPGPMTGGQLRIVPVNGGAPVTIVRDSLGRSGGDWASDGYVYFQRIDGRIARVAEGGGDVEIVSRLESGSGEQHAFPQLLPGGKSLLVMVDRRTESETELATLDISTGAITPLFAAMNGRYIDSGHLVFADATGALFTVPFNPSRGRVTASPTALGDVSRLRAAFADFAASPSGSLIYRPALRERDQLVWVDRKGNPTPVDSTWRGTMRNPALSPDGTRIAVAIRGEGATQIWVRPLPTGPRTLVSFGGRTNMRLRWSPDGQRVYFLSGRDPTEMDIVSRRFDASDPGDVVLKGGGAMNEIEWLPDGRTLIIRRGSMLGTRDLLLFTPGVDSVPRVILGGSADEYGPAISPDGRWLAHLSSESGRPEVYVRRFDDLTGARTPVSVEGAAVPVWARSGRELFWRGADGATMYAASVRSGAGFSADPPRLLFTQPDYQWEFFARAFDVSLDGSRFLMVSTAESETGEMVLVLNLAAAIRAASTDLSP